MKIQNGNFPSIEQLQDQYLKSGRTAAGKTAENGLSFRDILKRTAVTEPEETGLKFSKHASTRLADRNIALSSEQMERLQEGTQKACEKGIQESLVIVDSLAFIVNIPKQTVITAMEQGDTGGNIFTNIDGAVIM